MEEAVAVALHVVQIRLAVTGIMVQVPAIRETMATEIIIVRLQLRVRVLVGAVISRVVTHNIITVRLAVQAW
jgi:hypothetical protein